VVLAITAAITAFVKLRPAARKPVVTTVPEIQAPVVKPQLSKPFFEHSYQFEDSRHKGSMTFALSGDSSGTYDQSVLFKESGKTFKVHGIFTYDAYQITYRPDAYHSDIIWVLNEYNEQGHAVFYDPSEPDSEKSRVYLHREQ
jgi:hypothetical protein